MQAPPVAVMERAATLQELWNGFNAHRVAFLDLGKMEVAEPCGLSAVGRCACLAGDLHLVPGQFGAPSQASTRSRTPCCSHAPPSCPPVSFKAPPACCMRSLEPACAEVIFKVIPGRCMQHATLHHELVGRVLSSVATEHLRCVLCSTSPETGLVESGLTGQGLGRACVRR